MNHRTAIHYLDAREFGGAERVALVLAAGIGDAPGWRSVIAYHVEPGIAPLVSEARGLGVGLLPLPARGLLRGAGLTSLAMHMCAARPAVFHAHLPSPLAARGGLLAAAVARVPGVVATAHLHVALPHVWQRARVRASRVDRYIAVSRAVAVGLESFGISRHAIRVVPNGLVDVDAYGLPTGVTTPASTNGTLVTVARLVSQKGHTVLLDALTRLPGVTASFAGDGPLREHLEGRARRLGISDRTFFLGTVEDIPTLLARADLFVLTSLNEGLPLSILEAMAAGVAVVATRVGGTPELVIHGETGLLVDPEDPASTAEAIRRLLTDDDLRLRLGSRGRTLVREKYTGDRMVDGVLGVYEEVLDRRRGRFDAGSDIPAASRTLREE
jgi:glycosyltransferase involved in cell wall biosynthesis